MNKFHMNAKSMIAIIIIVIVGMACAAGGALMGYQKGYKTGDFDGRHEANRSALTAFTESMTDGFSIKHGDGSIKTYVLRPVETQTSKN